MKRNNLFIFFLALLALLFSFYLMFHTFSYDGQKQEMRIATKAWSDFGAHIPLIRSFSHGANLSRFLHGQPIESPHFPGEPIRYHFGFYAIVGLLERLGLRIDWALNIPSALGFFGLLVIIYLAGFSLFQNRWVSILSVIFFLFNGSLSFLQFFKTHSIAEIATNSRFASFGPWDGGPITAFWNLNIYTNQRHLAFSYALALIIFFTVLQCSRITHQGKKFLAGVGVGLLILLLWWFNEAVAAGVLVAGLLLFHASWRNSFRLYWQRYDPQFPRVADWFAGGVGLVLILAIPIFTRVISQHSIIEAPCYLAPQPFTWQSCTWFWFQNLGLHTILIPLGLMLAPRTARNILLPPLLGIFIIPNLFRLSPDMINNHKFFNFFLILGNMFSAYALVILAKRLRSFIGVLAYLFIGLLVVLSTLSGIIDFFPILNDSKGSIPDLTVNPDAHFFATQTQPGDVVANSTWFYHPASLAGRAMYSGYTYFTWSYGYDQGGRERTLESVYRAPDQTQLCQNLQGTRIAYVELNPNPESYLQPNWSLWNDLLPVYENPETKLRVYKTLTICNDQ